MAAPTFVPDLRDDVFVLSEMHIITFCVSLFGCVIFFLAIEDKKKFIDAVHVQDCRPYLCTIKSFIHSLHCFFVF